MDILHAITVAQHTSEQVSLVLLFFFTLGMSSIFLKRTSSWQHSLLPQPSFILWIRDTYEKIKKKRRSLYYSSDDDDDKSEEQKRASLVNKGD